MKGGRAHEVTLADHALALARRFRASQVARSCSQPRLWSNGVRCPHCGLGERITTRKGGFHRCDQKEDFTVRTGTIFERSHVPLHKWIYAMYLLVTARQGISSMQLSKEIGVTQKTAWFMLGRLREACGDNHDKLRGIVEIDEIYIGDKEVNKHADKKLHAGRGAVGKTAVLGMRERDGPNKLPSWKKKRPQQENARRYSKRKPENCGLTL